MNQHLAIIKSCFGVMELSKATTPARAPYLRPVSNSPAITRVPRLESELFNHHLFDPGLIRGSLAEA